MSSAKTLVTLALVAALASGAAFLLYAPSGGKPKVAAGFSPPPTISTPSSSQATVFPAQTPASNAVMTEKKSGRSFESSDDIWSFAVSALTSTNPSSVYEAYWASRECGGIVRMAPMLQNYASGVPSPQIPGPLTPERQQAIDALISKCSGFFKNGVIASQKLTKDLFSRGVSIGGAEFAQTPAYSASGNAAGNDAKTRAFVGSQSPAARDNAVPELTALVRAIVEDSGSVTGERSSYIAGISARLALCEMGKDCTRGSYSTLLQCATTGKCDDALWDGWEKGMSDEDIALVNQTKAKVVAALQDGSIFAIRSKAATK
jgi:hypothetical protein